MVNYQLGKIYKIVDNTNGNIYVGSTCEPSLARRMSKHVCDYKRYLEGKSAHTLTSFKIIENDNYDIVLIENYSCDTKDELHARERYYIESLNCVNKVVVGRTKIESDKAYREANKEKIKECYLENREKHLEWKNTPCYCECGGKYKNADKAKHMKTKKHLNSLKENI